MAADHLPAATCCSGRKGFIISKVICHNHHHERQQAVILWGQHVLYLPCILVNAAYAQAAKIALLQGLLQYQDFVLQLSPETSPRLQRKRPTAQRKK